MTDETRMEVLKALAYNESIEDVAEFAEVDEEEIVKIQDDYKLEIDDIRKEIKAYEIDE